MWLTKIMMDSDEISICRLLGKLSNVIIFIEKGKSMPLSLKSSLER